jgi:hypothetical protein
MGGNAVKVWHWLFGLFMGAIFYGAWWVHQEANAIEDRCAAKGGALVQGYDGAVCIKAEVIAE